MKKCASFEEQKGTRYIRRNVYFGIIVLSCLSPTKSCLRFLLICFAREMKGFCQSSLKNEVGFRDMINVSSNILGKIWNFKKLRHIFVDERTLITTTLISFCPFAPFCLRKKRPENKFLTLIVNYRKIVKKKKLCRPKQQKIGYLMIHDVICLLAILIEKLAFFNRQF